MQRMIDPKLKKILTEADDVSRIAEMYPAGIPVVPLSKVLLFIRAAWEESRINYDSGNQTKQQQ